MKYAAIVALALLVVISGSAAQQGARWHFDDLPAGRPPPDFLFPSSPKNQVDQWVVLREGSNGVLALTHQEQPGAQLAIVDGLSFTNLSVSVRLRFAKGAGSAGLVWRYRDADHYYLAALDLRAQDVRLYRVVRGNRTRLEDEDDLELDPGVWHLLKVEHQGETMRVWINGVPVADEEDRTFEAPGAIGLWTTGAAGAWFDDLRVEPVSRSDYRHRRK